MAKALDGSCRLDGCDGSGGLVQRDGPDGPDDIKLNEIFMARPRDNLYLRALLLPPAVLPG